MVAPRILVVHLPAFRVERCGWTADETICITDEWKSATRLAAVSPAAAELGLRYGMTASEARALEPDVILEPLDADGEIIDRLALAEAFRGLSARVGLLWNEDVGLDVSETAHLFGGEAGILQRARELCESFGHVCRLAVADDVLAAGALAASGDEDAVLADLPIAALRPSPDLELALETIGIDRIGDFAALDAASVSGRFGDEGIRLYRVANGGIGSEWLPVVEEAFPVRVSVQLGASVTRLEPIFFALRGLVAQICEQLFRRDQVAIRLALRFTLDSGPLRLVRIRVGRPTRNPETLLRVLHMRLEDLKLDAPAVDLAVEVEESAPDGGVQPSLHDRTEASEPLPDLVARLTDAMGEGSIVDPVLVEAWRPEGAWRDGQIDGPAPPGRPSTMKVDPVEVLWKHEGHLRSPRPTLLLPRARIIEVKLRQGRPAMVHAETGRQPVLRLEGPERLQGEWWADDRGFDRDYWVVGLPEGTAWIFREGERWYLHGWFD